MRWARARWPSAIGQKSARNTDAHAHDATNGYSRWPFINENVCDAIRAGLIVLSLHMGAYWGLWVLFGWIGCTLGYVPAWCPQPLP